MGFWDIIKTTAQNAVDVIGIAADGAENVEDIYGSIADIHAVEDRTGYAAGVQDLDLEARQAAVDRGEGAYDRYWPFVIGAVAFAVVAVVVLNGRK